MNVDLKRFREEHLLTLKELSELSNVSICALYKYENNFSVRKTTEDKIKKCIEKIVEEEEKKRYE